MLKLAVCWAIRSLQLSSSLPSAGPFTACSYAGNSALGVGGGGGERGELHPVVYAWLAGLFSANLSLEPGPLSLMYGFVLNRAMHHTDAENVTP